MKDVGTKRIETERLILRKIRMEDALESFNNWCNSEKVDKYVMWDKHSSVDVTRKLYEMWIEQYKDLSTYRWIVELKDSHELIGTIDVASKKFQPYGACEIGYCYGDKYWGKGYATEALKAVIKFLFEETDTAVVFAQYMSNNPASGMVMKKSGMQFEGLLRGRILDKDGYRNDLGSYSITREEYQLSK